MKITLLFIVAGVAFGAATPSGTAPKERELQLRKFLLQEQPAFKKREKELKGVIDQMDALNQQQNQVRSQIHGLQQTQQELSVGLDNLTLELKKQREVEAAQKKRLLLFLKVVYKIHKDGLVKFVARGEDSSSVVGRTRLLYRALRAHGVLTKELSDRAERLADGEKQLSATQAEMQKLLKDLSNQERSLENLRKQKRQWVKTLNQKQGVFESARKEYAEISKQISSMFDEFESTRVPSDLQIPVRGSLTLPVEGARLVQKFGKHIHKVFHTITYQKGIELAAPYNTEVKAVSAGTVEFEGWVRGLGNVVIVHHGGGIYSLSGHLFKSQKVVGNFVEKGDVIGLVGDTGESDIPSLYFELRDGRTAVDPLPYFLPTERARLSLEMPQVAKTAQ